MPAYKAEHSGLGWLQMSTCAISGVAHGPLRSACMADTMRTYLTSDALRRRRNSDCLTSDVCYT